MEARAAHRPKNYMPEAPGRVSLYTWGPPFPAGACALEFYRFCWTPRRPRSGATQQNQRIKARKTRLGL